MQYSVATEIYGVPACYDTLLQSISNYRKCLTVLTDSFDAAFNLAQALHTLGEWVSDGAPLPSLSGMQAKGIWTEAKTILQQLAEAQMASLAQRQSHDTDTQSTSANAESPPKDPPDASHDTEPLGEVEVAEEEQLITASTVIETLLVAVEVDLSLLDYSESDGADLIIEDAHRLLRQAFDLDAVDHYMQQEIAKTRQEVRREIAEFKLAAGGSPDPTELLSIKDDLQSQLQAVRRPDPQLVSDYADTLVLLAEMALSTSGTPDLADAARLLEEAIAAYENVVQSLVNPLQRPGGLPTHHVPSLISAVHVSTANANILSALVSAALSQDPTTCIARTKSPALAALNACSGPFKVSASSNPPSTPAFARTPKSAARSDIRTVQATKDAIIAILRTHLIEQIFGSSSEHRSSDESLKQNLNSLLKAAWPEESHRSSALEKAMNVLKDGTVQRMCDRYGWGKETEVWLAFFG